LHLPVAGAETKKVKAEEDAVSNDRKTVEQGVDHIVDTSMRTSLSRFRTVSKARRMERWASVNG
jgi:hypothetical protein